MLEKKYTVIMHHDTKEKRNRYTIMPTSDFVKDGNAINIKTGLRMELDCNDFVVANFNSYIEADNFTRDRG